MDQSDIQNKPEEVVVPEKQPEIETTNDRTKEQFEKLKTSNQELHTKKEEVEKERDYYKNVLESLRPDYQQGQQEQSSNINQGNTSHLSQNQVNSAVMNFVDESGYVDTNKLNQFLKETNDRAIRAERAAREAQSQSLRTVRDFEETEQVRRTHSAFPEVDPKSDKFDANLYDYVQNEIIAQMRKGEKEDMYEATKKWHAKLYKKQESKEEVARRESGENARAQINATPSGNASKPNRLNSVDLDYLKAQTRLGNSAALHERLKRAGY